MRTSPFQQALNDFRPFLSYNELGGILDSRRLDLYRALTAGLGLEELEEARETLRKAKLDLRHTVEQARATLAPLWEQLQKLDDPRAQAAHEALGGREWDLDRAGRLAAGDIEGLVELEPLRRLAGLIGPEPDQLGALCGELRAVAAEQRAQAGAGAERDLQLAELLDQTLGLLPEETLSECPVCGVGRLGSEWRIKTRQQIAELRQRSQTFCDLRQKAESVLRRALDYCSIPLALLEQAPSLGIPADDAVEATGLWNQKHAIQDLDQLAEHLEQAGPLLAEALEQVRRAAGDELDRRQAAWLPLARALSVWLDTAHAAERAQGRLQVVEDAEQWLANTMKDIQRERFEPVAARAREVWNLLRSRSNVDLDEIALQGAGSHGRVALGVTVDGRPGAAMGVMSQGELHSLALSLFIPRATREDSPFRFVVIDDPVQSMDSARVDGLAQVLAHCARTRQVIVFTHDTRLPESIRRLQIEATVLEVVREPGSVVTTRVDSDPVHRYLDDAWALLRTADLPPRARVRTVPVLCRMALEASCVEALKRRWLGSGRSHAEVEALLESPLRLYELASLVFYADPKKADQVNAWLGRIGPWAVEVFRLCNRGTHVEVSADLEKLVRDTEKLAQSLRRAR